MNMTEHIRIKHKLENISRVSEFENILADCKISDEDKEILRLIYVKRKTVGYIADTLGYSENTVKRKHDNALKLLNDLL
jgi:DNA-directed RNA polymerase specialized sigma subunit